MKSGNRDALLLLPLGIVLFMSRFDMFYISIYVYMEERSRRGNTRGRQQRRGESSTIETSTIETSTMQVQFW